MNRKQVAKTLVALAEKLAGAEKSAASNADLSRYKTQPYLDVTKEADGIMIYFADSPVEYLWADDKQEVNVWLDGIIK